MIYTLYFLILFGTAEASMPVMLRGPTYDTREECVKAGNQFRMQTELPVYKTMMHCDGQKVADQKKPSEEG